MAQITLENIDKKFASNQVIKDLSLSVPDGAFVTLLGSSGCGKTTCLRLIAGLEPVSGGTVRFGDDDVTDLPASRRDIAMVFQSYALYPHMDVRSNIGFALKMMGMASAEIDRRVEKAAGALGLAALLSRKPWQLSGGQRQRVALGRAIVREAAVLLMDEPLSNLDVALRVSARREIKRLHQDLGQTIVYVTHDQEEAIALSDWIAVMANGQIQQFGTPGDIYDRPANTLVASFVGSPEMNLLDGTLADGGRAVATAAGTIKLAERYDASASVKLGIRPEQVTIGASGPDAISGKVALVEPNGADSYVTVDIGSLSIVARSPRAQAPNVGETTAVTLSDRRLHLFDAQSGLRIEEAA